MILHSLKKPDKTISIILEEKVMTYPLSLAKSSYLEQKNCQTMIYICDLFCKIY